MRAALLRIFLTLPIFEMKTASHRLLKLGLSTFRKKRQGAKWAVKLVRPFLLQLKFNRRYWRGLGYQLFEQAGSQSAKSGHADSRA